jgi:spermidine/putrescine-binding protein
MLRHHPPTYTHTHTPGAADIVTLGDAWLGPAIQQQLIQPIPSAETYRWWRRLPRRWQDLMRRGPDGRPSERGDVWGCPYRWGATLVAYKKDFLLRRGGRPVRDWSDLLQPQLRGKIAFAGSSREFVGIALKSLAEEGGSSGGGGSSRRLGFNADAAGLAAAGVDNAAARDRVRALLRQARTFSDRDHTRTLMAGDVWAVVGTSEDLVPLAERTPSLELVAPMSGTALWADVWAVPKGASGGHLKMGPSPTLPAWLEFGVLPAREATLGSLR